MTEEVFVCSVRSTFILRAECSGSRLQWDEIEVRVKLQRSASVPTVVVYITLEPDSSMSSRICFGKAGKQSLSFNWYVIEILT